VPNSSLVWDGYVTLQRADHPAGLGVEVEHRGFEVAVTKDHLQVAHKSPTVQGVGNGKGLKRWLAVG
jgi:hypothetical protein